MSPPPPTWRIRGGANYRSVTRAKVNPRRAFGEWLALADAIEACGAAVGVVPPPDNPGEPLTGLMYTANAGWLRSASRFHLARLTVAHRQAERAYLSGKLAELFGWAIEEAKTPWEGQADMCWLSEGMILLTYGVRSTRESVDEIAALLPTRQKHVPVRLREPFFHGDTCMDLLSGSNPVFLVLPGAFATPEDYRQVSGAASNVAEILEISEADALAYACNSLCLGDEVLIPTGLSSELRQALSTRGYRLRELDFTELFGKGGGGPRCLVNDLRGLPELPRASRYSERRPSLQAALERYPTTEIP